ncbi:hypothetical protein [Anabaena subtropica]|uniref:Secreted protein n=1 Tax=Anabaena subtropica FACHB-260 TaxID=2692884 RepID=A0ABR8CKH4_9NOST|nr:hypothetical protein [Anabaena subtropica]MBD2343494.1 hypothetical protein [Anabaena subtropica FACHB-260]
MKKQQFSLSLVLVLLVSLVSTPVRVNAGSAGITGGSDDSGSFSGDNFNPANFLSSPEIAPGVNAEVGSDRRLRISREVQNCLNATIANRQQENPSAIILTILQGGSNGAEAANQLQASLGNSGIAVSSAQTLVGALLGLAENQSASASDVPASTLVVDSETEQQQESLNVDINKLNAAINDYNQIVMESNSGVLQKLTKDENFQEIGKLLKQLRVDLNKC